MARELTVSVLRKILEAFGWEDAIKPTTKKRRKDNLKYKHLEILIIAELDWPDIEDKEQELGKTF